MKSCRALGAAAFLLLIAVAPKFHAQTAAESGTAKPFGYNANDEVTVSGAATELLTKAPKGMLNGSHLFISNSSGAMDISLGSFGSGKEADEISTGKSVEITGLMKTLNGKQVLLARVVKVGDQVYLIRTKQGVVVSARARQQAVGKANQDGGTL
jgi:hypothetical protein